MEFKKHIGKNSKIIAKNRHILIKIHEICLKISKVTGKTNEILVNSAKKIENFAKLSYKSHFFKENFAKFMAKTIKKSTQNYEIMHIFTLSNFIKKLGTLIFSCYCILKELHPGIRPL